MNQIETQMTRLKLYGMAKAWTALKEARKNQSLSLTEGLELLLQSEELEKDNRRFKRLEHTAQFRYKASLEELKLDRTRGLDELLLASLATGDYLTKGESVLIHWVWQKLSGFRTWPSGLSARIQSGVLQFPETHA
jgi:DNA replication protein DnaC